MSRPIPLTILAARGAAGTVEFAVLRAGKCPAQEFFELDCENIREGGKDEPETTARARFAFLFQQIANHGNLSPKRFKKEMGDFFAFRHEVRNIQIRFPCFRDGTRWIVTHGFRKPGARRGLGAWPKSEVDRAKEIRAQYLARQNEAQHTKDEQ
jgi:hypothetical protein